MRSVFILASSILLAGSLGVPVAAHATDSTETFRAGSPPAVSPADETTVDEVIYVDGPVPRTSDEGDVIYEKSDSQGDVVVTRTDDFPVVPEPGESVKLIYTDGVTVITTEPQSEARAAADCTKSATAAKPTKSNNRIRGYGAGSISSGCSSGDLLRVTVYGAFSVQYGTNTVQAYNNNTTVSATTLSGTCVYGFDANYGTSTGWNGGGGASSGSTSLPCSYP